MKIFKRCKTRISYNHSLTFFTVIFLKRKQKKKEPKNQGKVERERENQRIEQEQEEEEEEEEKHQISSSCLKQGNREEKP